MSSRRITRIGENARGIERGAVRSPKPNSTLGIWPQLSPCLIRQGRERSRKFSRGFGLKPHEHGERAAEFAGFLDDQSQLDMASEQG